MIGQFGAPTAVVNAILEGFVRRAARYADAYGLENGPMGIVEGNLVRLSPAYLARAAARPGGPGAVLGSGRRFLTDEDLDRAVSKLVAKGVSGVALVGGNGTMEACERFAGVAAGRSVDLAVVGLPKTIDNDLCETDHTLGFPSAARFVASIVADLDADHRAMAGTEPVRILETLGRDVGWLALSTFAAKRREDDAPHLVLLPEGDVHEEDFLERVGEVVGERGRAFVVVAEGYAGRSGESEFRRRVFDRPISGGVARRLASLVESELGLYVRAEVPGLLQRSSRLAVSPVDRSEARRVGAFGARLLQAGTSGVMVAILADRTVGYGSRLETVDLTKVAGRSRSVPERWAGATVRPPKGFREWLLPLLGTSWRL